MQVNFLNIPSLRLNPLQARCPQTCQLQPQLTADTVSFTAKRDLLDLPDRDILDKINETIQNETNFIGEGAEAVVYRIPDSNYCVRIHRSESEFKPVLDRNIQESDKVNHVVAKFGKESSIMRYIKGVPVMTPTATLEELIKIGNDIAQMPVKSFHELLRQVCHAYDNGMLFDCSWCNVIVNKEENKLTAIDFNKNIFEESIKPLNYIFSSLSHSYTTLEQSKIYMNKILNAALEEFKPKHEPFWNVTYFDFYGLLNKLALKRNFDKTLECAQLGENFERLKKLKVQDIQGIDVSKVLTETLKQTRALIKQTF